MPPYCFATLASSTNCGVVIKLEGGMSREEESPIAPSCMAFATSAFIFSICSGVAPSSAYFFT
jgi:hypothetical protein